MRQILSIAPLAFLVAGLAACTAKAPPAPVAPAPAPAAPAAKHEMKKMTATAAYPLKTCVVSGEELGAMGDRVAYSYDGTEVQFCCPDCVPKFEKDPAPFLAKITAARK